MLALNAPLATLLEDVADVILLLDREGRIRFASASAARVIGEPDDSLLDRPALDLIHPDDQVPARRVVEQVLAAPGRPATIEVRLRHAEGWRDVRAVVVNRLEDPGIEALVVTARNVTALRRTEAVLAVTAERYRQLFSAAPVGVYQSTPEGTILVANRRLAEILGYDDPATLGRMNMRDLYWQPTEREALIREWDTTGRVADLDVRWRRRDGTPIWVRMTAHAVRDREGRTQFFEGFIRDVTDERRVQEELRRSERRYRTIVEHAPDGIVVFDVDTGAFVEVNANAEALYGGTRDQLLGLGPVDLSPPTQPDGRPSAEAAAGHIAEALAGGTPTFEWMHRRLDGREVLCEVRLVRMPDEDRTLVRGSVSDITELRQAEETLRQSQKMEAVGQLTGGIAHDFNNILTVMLANVDLIAGADTAGALETELRDLRAAALRGQAMVKKLLGFARRTTLERRLVNPGEVLQDVATLLRRVLPEDIAVETDVPAHLPLIRADVSAVEQILLNLATNARDAMPDGGRLTVTARHLAVPQDLQDGAEPPPAGEYVALDVGDTGGGMEEEVRLRVFEPFFTTKPVGQGTGLGLAMVYGLVRQHGGHVRIDSAPGVGTTVRVLFPVDLQTEFDFSPPTRTPGGSPRGTETILLVEDEADVRRATARLLERFGYRVLAAEDGQEGLARWRAQADRIDLILTDVVMPRLGGKGLYDAVRDAGGTVPFLFASGYTGRDGRAAAVLDENLPFMAKPWELEDLLARIREVLDASR